MSIFSEEELFVDFDIPKKISGLAKTSIYERGTKIMVGTVEFREDGSITLYIRNDMYKRIRVNSIEDINKRLSGKTYRLSSIDIKGNKDEGPKRYKYRID